MGKLVQQNLRQQQRDSGFLCARCSRALRRVVEEFNFKCFFFLILGFSVFLSGIFWVLPLHSMNNGFDAKNDVKAGAVVQAYFRLEKPVKELLPCIERLEYDINGEIGVPDLKVAILSMHEGGSTNSTPVVFGYLSEPSSTQMSSVSLNLLRSSLLELFLRKSNLTLTASIFGQPSTFEILEFYGGISVIPPKSASIWLMPQILFNFTLNNSISDVLDNSDKLMDQLKFGLRLLPHEHVFVQITNKNGSTILPPVIIQASVMSDLGSISPERLKELAEIITGSPARNLGLDNTVFGKVKGIILSSYLKRTLHATPPTLSPAPAPEPSDCPVSSNPQSDPPIADAHPLTTPSFDHSFAPTPHSYSDGPSPQVSPHLSLTFEVSYDSADSVEDLVFSLSSSCTVNKLLVFMGLGGVAYFFQYQF